MNQPVTSREYKLILNADRFVDCQLGIELFWQLIEFLIEKQQGKSKPDFEKEARTTWYLDTTDFQLYRHKFILRVRKENNKTKITLKYRHLDRYLSASQDLSCSETSKGKFEEDILASGLSNFSHSVSIKTKDKRSLNTIDDAIALFPGLGKLDIRTGTHLTIVNQFIAHEFSYQLGHLDFAGDKTKSKAILNFWYYSNQKNFPAIIEFPLVVEFSFDYDAYELEEKTLLEDFPLSLVEQSHYFFNALKKQVGWVSQEAVTKTAYAYQV